MEEDFRRGNSNFKFKEKQSLSSDLDELCLYVKNVPLSVTQDCFFRLMSEGGRSVKSIMINKKVHPNSDVTYGFVNFSNPKDCGDAFSALNGKPPYNFIISFAKKRKDAEYKDSNNADNRELMDNSFSPYHPHSSSDSFHKVRRRRDFHSTCEKQNDLHSKLQSFGGVDAISNGVRNVNVKNETPCLGGGKGRAMRIDLNGVKAISQLKIVAEGRGRTVMLESPEKHECKQDNIISDLKSPPTGAIQNKRMEIGAPELVSNPFYLCFYCKKEARFACGYCRKPFCSRNCQTVDWPHHQNLCKLAKGVSESLLESYKSSHTPSNDSSYMSESSSDCEKPQNSECSVVKTMKRHSNETQPRRTRLDSSSVKSPPENIFNVRRMPLNTRVSEKPIEHMPLKEGDVEKVSITNIESPSKFWVQLDKFSSILLILEKELASNQKMNISSAHPNMFCCTQFNNKIYRGKIMKEKSPHEVVLYLVDYGKTLTTSKNNIFQLPEESRKYPMQAVCCKLVDTQTGNIEWNSEDLDSFQLHTANKQHKAVVLKYNSEINEVSLVNEDGISLYSLLVLGRSTNSGMDDLPQSSESDGAPPSIWSKIKPGSCLTLAPVIVNENVVWCYLFIDKDSSVQDINEIERLLLNYSSEDVTLCAEEGDFVAGFSPEYQQFYRCVILKRKRGSFLVRYIDYGNEEEITCLNSLSPELFHKFSYLVKCEKPASLSADDFSTAAEVFVVKIEKNVAELSIDLGKKQCMNCYPCYPTCFDKLTLKGSTPSIEEISHVSKIVDPKLHAEKIMKLKTFSLNMKYNVKVVFIKTVSEVFVQLNEEEKEMNAMFIEFNKYCNSVNSVYNPNVGEIVCCKFSDGVWYRGQVKERVNDKYLVFFVDYGNEDIVSPNDIQHLSEKFTCPKYSVCVSLSGIQNEDVSQHLLDKLLKENWDMKIIDSKKSPLEVMLFLKDSSLTDLIQHENSLKRNKSLLKFKKLPTGVPVNIKITHEENGILYVHQVEDIKSLEEMCIKINSLKPTPVPKKVFVNNLYCGLFTDSLWYRVTVIEETSSNVYKVQFLDYGNIEKVPIKDLRELPDDVFTLPIYCIPVVVQDRNKYADLNLEDQYVVEVVDNKKKFQEIKLLSVPEAVKLPNISSLKKQQLNNGLNDVLICHAEDSLHYCQLSTDNDEVLDLFKKLQKFSEGDSPKILNEGNVIAAKSSDGFWYRASVVSVKMSPSYKVLFFDYGNAEAVTFDCIKILPEELLKYPIFAIPMKIENIADVKDSEIFTSHVPVKKIKTSNDNVHIVEIVLKNNVSLPKFSAMQKITLPSGTFKITLCYVEGDVFFVHVSSNENMFEKLRCSLLEASKFDSLSEIPKEGDVICAKFTDNVWYRSSVQEVLADNKSLKVSFFDYGNSETVTLEDARILPSELCSYPIFSAPVKFNNLDALEKVLLQNLDTFDVKVIGMNEDVQVVDVALANDVENVPKIIYNPVYLSSFTSSSLTLNEMCKIIFKNSKGNFYFAVKSSDCDEMKNLSSILQNANTEVISHTPSVNEVLLVKRSDNLWHRGCITESDSDANMCGVYFIDLGITENITKTSICCLPEICKSFPVFVIKTLVETDEPIILEKIYYAYSLKQNSDGTFSIKVYHSHMVSAINKQELPLCDERSVIFFHKENDLLYLQDVSSIEVLSEVQTALAQCSSHPSIPYKPAVGELLCAKSQLDDSWYRGCVEDVVSSNEYKIRFIDYGNCEQVNEQDLQCIPSMLTKFPSLCIPVKFANYKVSDSIELEKLYTVVSESKPFNDIQIIRLVEDVKSVKDVANENEISSCVNEVKKYKYTQCTFVPFSAAGEQDVVIYSVDEGFVVFCAPFNQNNINANILLPSELTKYCTSKGKPFENGCELEMDDMVLAKFSEDGQWYRAAVIDKAHPLYDVNFVDYGNSEQLDISQLRKMEEQFMALDIQANLCSLTGFTAPDKNLPEVYKELKKFTVFSCPDPLKAEVRVKGEDIFISVPRITAHLVEKNLAVISNENL